MTGPPPQAPPPSTGPNQAPNQQPSAPTAFSDAADSWEAKALAASLGHVVENVGLHFLGGGKEYPAPSEAQKNLESVHPTLKEARQAVASFFPSSETLDKGTSGYVGAITTSSLKLIIRKLCHGPQNGAQGLRADAALCVASRTSAIKLTADVRIGMHLLFVSGRGKIQQMLKTQSVREGKLYDATGPQVKQHIAKFIATYQLDTSQLLEQDLDKYPLVPGARPIASADDPSVIDSPADCRLSCFDTVSDATKFWVKGKQFTIPHLLGAIDDDTAKGFTDVSGDNATTATSQKQPANAPSDPKSEIAKNPKVTNNTNISDQKQDQALQSFLRHSDYALAVARLAPQDYHRFHSPVDGVLVSQTECMDLGIVRLHHVELRAAAATRKHAPHAELQPRSRAPRQSQQ
ncbi:hypothetical protein A1Q2_07453 [Trichosporon asahii var. asahii CBS 8904]|uniref:Phosphatidylserine decarboxylase n=1 Tax=Trichosporon asahii var. asahii (strain CBS 8904) TaxID=1220162 RepID=K1V3B8_TRIAC|nr:hypothetical protein A1Q2_07453 [Trichosporon asahii var. asahii CBS 8904]